jgi:proteasome accessory factor B
MGISPTERIVNLALFLASSREPVSATEIAAGVPGYSADQKPDAFARMFERDKEDLRRAGIVITVEKTDVERYRFEPAETYADQVDLDPVEAMELRAAAASMLADPSFPYTDDLKTAVAKVVAGANRRIGSSSAILSSASADEGPELQADTVAELTGAIERGKRVRFSYTGAEGKRSEREVEPWGLFARDGRWYAVAWDASAEGERVFAVSRMRDVVVNPSKPKSPDFERPSHFDVAEWMVLPFQYGPRTVEARLRFSGAAARRASALAAGQGRLETAGADVIWSVPVADESLLVRWILEHGPGIAVLEPVSVKETLAEGLAKVVRIHG